jgi:hypothetical protein
MRFLLGFEPDCAKAARRAQAGTTSASAAIVGGDALVLQA